jgi:predicted metalloenzyme YecM
MTDASKIDWEALLLQTSQFSDRLCVALQELKILESCKNLKIEHICVRLKNNKDVDILKTQLLHHGEVICSANVNGREISIIQLRRPIKLREWEVYGVELPYPKPDHSYEDGWEHVEFVLDEAENNMEDLRAMFFSKFKHLNVNLLKSKYDYSEDEPQANDDQIPNPTIGLKLNGIGIKFHARSIQQVVGYETVV